MAPLSSLPAPQRAVLALVLEKGKTYDEIAALLQLDVDGVRERAHLALAALAPGDGARPAARHRAAIGNYLLGQDPDRATATVAYLETSVAGRAWARALAAELAELDPGRLPEIPPDPPDPPLAQALPDPLDAPPSPAALPPETGPGKSAPTPPPPPAPADLPPPHVSRRGGALLIIGAVVVLAAVAGALLLFTGGGSPRRRAPAKAAPSATAPAKLAAQINLRASPGSRASGLAAVIVRGTQRVIAIAAAGLRPTSTHLAYGVWLYNAPADFRLIGFVPPVKADGKISAAAPLPTGAARFHAMVVTRETSARATRPGQILLTGALPAGAAG